MTYRHRRHGFNIIKAGRSHSDTDRISASIGNQVKTDFPFPPSVGDKLLLPEVDVLP